MSCGAPCLPLSRALSRDTVGYPPLVPWAFVTTAVYSGGFPAFLCWLFFRTKNKQLILRDQLLRAQGHGHTRDSNPQFAWRQAYGALYYRFRPEHYYWMVVIVARKFWIVMAALLFREEVCDVIVRLTISETCGIITTCGNAAVSRGGCGEGRGACGG